MNKKIRVLLVVALIISALTVTSVYAYENILLPNSYNSIVEYSKIEKSKAGLDKHKQFILEKNKKLKEAKLTDVMATITFEKAISVDELENYINTHNIKPVQVQDQLIKVKSL